MSTPNFIVDSDLINRIESARSRLDGRYQRGIRQYPITEGRTDAKSAELSSILEAVTHLDSALLCLGAADRAMSKGYHNGEPASPRGCECDEPERETRDGGRWVICTTCGREA